MCFQDIVYILMGENNTITTRDTLLDFTVKNIMEDNLFLIIHILNNLQNTNADFSDYDYLTGTIERLSPIENKEDLI